MDFSPIVDYVENVLLKEKNVPGCDLKIMRDHQTLFRYSSGVSDYDGKKPVSPDDIYLMYSCSKPMTCAAALQLVEKGIIGLDDPVSKYLPAFKDAFLIKDGKKCPPENTMTVRHLFTMSAGFNYDLNAAPIKAAVAQNPDASTVDIVSAFIQSPLQFEPGQQYLYSLCHDVLAAVVVVASGMRYSQYLKQNIWDPLGMTETGFEIPEKDRHRVAALYQATGTCRYEPYSSSKREFNFTKNYESGGAGLYSTVNDYSLFSDAMACGGVGATGNRILKAETIDLMRTEQLSSYIMDPRFGCPAGAGYGYGLGVRTLVDKSDGQRSSIGEFGWDGAAGAYIMMDPKYNLSICFAMHVRGWPHIIGHGHADIRDLTYEILGI